MQYQPELHRLVHELREKKIKDLEYLLKQTKVFENPAEENRKILEEICVTRGINLPWAGE